MIGLILLVPDVSGLILFVAGVLALTLAGLYAARRMVDRLSERDHRRDPP